MHKILIIYFSLLMAFICQSTIGQDERKPETYIAKVGNVFINEREFVRRYELLPGFKRNRKSQLESAKAEFLYTMIAEKLLAQEAVEHTLDRDSVFQQAFLTIKKKLSRDELYREEISQKIRIIDVDIIRGMARSRNLVFTSYLYFPKKQDAYFVRNLIRKLSDFENLKIDSSIDFLRDTATVIWGGADPALEDAVYRLKKGEVSPVIKAGSGYYIAKVLNIQKNKYFDEMQPNALREHVTDIIRLNRERVRLDEYVSQTLKNKKGFSEVAPFGILLNALQVSVSESNNKSDGIFSTENMNAVRKRCSVDLRDTLVIVGDSYWTMGDVIDRLSNKYVDPASIDSVKIPFVLNTQIQVLVQQELLEQEALSLGLDQRPSVKEKLTMWHDAMLASRMKEYIQNSVPVSEQEIYAFLKSTNQQIDVPHVQLRLLKTKTLETMAVALNEINRGMKFEDAVKMWSIDSASLTNGGVTEYFPINERSPIGEFASHLDSGQTYGPITYEDGYLVFELLGKREKMVPIDSAFERRYQSAKTNLVNMKAKRTLNRFLAQIAEKRGIAVYEDRLKQIEVTAIPMMTYRILGFGGRMFEVPFVDPQLDWLNVEPPNTKINP